MEGHLLTPPDRGAIIGRAVWKTRYVIVGSPPGPRDPPNPKFYEQATSRVKDVVFKSQPKADGQALCLSIFRSKEDWEPVHQYPLASVADCQIQEVAHRKQGPALPTMCIQIAPDPVAEKLRKRRSSRTAGLTTSAKDVSPTTLWFRLPDDTPHQLADWAHCIRNLMRPDRHPISPISPSSPSFVNPFASSSKDANEYFASSPSGPSRARASGAVQKTSTRATASSRDTHTSYTSGSPSLRSRRSDLSSSHASSTYPAQPYASILPGDLPSPAVTIGEYQESFIGGWTSAQGRSSTLSSPIRGGSISSAQYPAPPGAESSSPPMARGETILDRAFQMRYIPGSDQNLPGEENLSSLARFDALMREAEDRRKAQERDAATIKDVNRSTFEEDDDSDEDDDDDDVDSDDDDDDDSDDIDSGAFESDLDNGSAVHGRHRQPQPLSSLASRNSSVYSPRPRGHHPRQSMSYHESQGLMGGSSILRPQTAHSKLRPAAHRSNSQSQVQSPASSRHADDVVISRNNEKRHSASSTKRLSFNEFTKRLSSTSSLLLVQTNNSNGSRPGSTEIEATLPATPRAGTSPRSLAELDRGDERCRWRGSVGVFGSHEGGFL